MAPRLTMWVGDWLVLSRRATYPPPWVRSGHHPPRFKSVFPLHSQQDCAEHPHLLSGVGGWGVDLTLWFRVCLSSWFLNHDLELTRLGLLPERYLNHFPATRQASHQSGKKAREVISDQEGTFWINQRSPQLPSTITIPWMRSRGKKEPPLTHPPSK